MSERLELIVPNWPAPPGIVAASTTRGGGVSSGVYASLNLGAHVGDDVGNVTENRRRLVTQCRLPDEPRWLQQVHGSTVATNPQAGEEADAAYTRETGLVCVVQTADCLPVVLAAADGSELACVHAGWRGLAAGVLECTLARFDAAPDAILAWLGPAIGQAAFEVGEEVRAAFESADAGAGECFRANEVGRWQADLYALARRRLRFAGVTQVFGGDHCTHADEKSFFSYRREGQCGRMATFAYRLG